MTEEELIQRLKKIERLFAGASTDGERDAASNALDRVRGRLQDVESSEVAVEYKFSLPDQWSRRLFSALLRRYGIEPYRYKRQRHTTVMAKVPKSFVDSTLWPEFVELDDVLKTYITEITERVIRDHIHEDSSEATLRNEAGDLRIGQRGSGI